MIANDGARQLQIFTNKREYDELAKLKNFFSFSDTKKTVDWGNIAQELLTKPGVRKNSDISKIIKEAQARQRT
jgi:hypothetical protein